MRELTAFVGNVRMTAAILVLFMTSIIGWIAIVSAAIYVNLHSEAIAERPAAAGNLALAATILERRFAGSVLGWTPKARSATQKLMARLGLTQGDFMSGARITFSTVLDLALSDGERAIATMCIGVGPRIAIALARS